MKTSKFLITALVVLLFQSCIKDVNFDQIEDANIYSSYIVTLVHLNLTAPKFLDELNQEIEVTSDFIEAPISEESEPYLEKVEFTVITENTFNRNISMTITFFDVFGNPIYVLQPIINAPQNSPELTTVIEIPKQDIHFIYDTQFFGFKVFLAPSTDGSTISIDDTSTFNFKSSVELFFNFRKL